ncbi:MAG: hypothetical protein R6V14_07805 [Halanaerobiales bacterium]
MVEKKCKACGATYHKGEEYYKCNECGDIYCHNCANNYSEKEKEISESAKHGDKDRYVRAVCPSCETEMFRFQ